VLSIFILAICAGLSSLLLTPVVRDFALRRQWVDEPDLDRKRHSIACPRLGGVPIAIAYTTALVTLLLIDPWSRAALSHFDRAWEILAAGAVMFAIGLFDDFTALKPWQKLAGEIAAATLMWDGGVQIHTLGHFVLPNAWGALLTIGWLVGCTNAFNLIDGADGLAGGLALVASLAVLAAGIVHRDAAMILISAPLAAALVGFLRFNFNPATIFLGDCGSLLVGFLLASSAVIWSQKASTLLAITAPAMAFAVPLFDTSISILRRFLRRQPIFSADRDHIHHRLLDRGFSTRRLVCGLYIVAMLMAILALIETSAGPVARASAFGLFCILLYAAVHYLRYREFGLAMRAFRQNGIRAVVKSQLSLGRCEDALRTASTLDQCWQAIRAIGLEFGFADVALCVHGHTFRQSFQKCPTGHWTLHIPLNGADYIRFLCPFELQKTPTTIGPLAYSLHRILTAKTSEIPPHPDEVRAKAAEYREKRSARTRAIAAIAGMAKHRETESLIKVERYRSAPPSRTR
jgi:UDP-GlcNAc:undecaprenyl-phosphate GlcNAc-1-phosphate transferase